MVQFRNSAYKTVQNLYKIHGRTRGNFHHQPPEYATGLNTGTNSNISVRTRQ